MAKNFGPAGMDTDAYARWKSRILLPLTDIAKIEKEPMIEKEPIEAIDKLVAEELCAVCGNKRSSHDLEGRNCSAIIRVKMNGQMKDFGTCRCSKFMPAVQSKQCPAQYHGMSGKKYRCLGVSGHSGNHQYVQEKLAPCQKCGLPLDLCVCEECEIARLGDRAMRKIAAKNAASSCCCDDDNVPETIGHIHEYGIICPSCPSHYIEARRIAIIQRDSHLGWKK
jgi:hypothetical protein